MQPNGQFDNHARNPVGFGELAARNPAGFGKFHVRNPVGFRGSFSLRARFIAGMACGVVLSAFFFSEVAFAADPLPSRVDFNRDIRPILSNTCFKCHGPDEQERQANLRLDTREGALEELDTGAHAIVPGEPDESELLVRIDSEDPTGRMPPPGSGKSLTPREIELFRRWINAGAPYAKHWSYVKPERPELPALSPELKEHVRNEIDAFILDRVSNAQLTPAPEADRYALIRRLSLDLTGLPPTLEEVNQFVQDDHPDAYEQLVDRLLAKEAYGEHWGRIWLDLARYADSAGYADDPARTIWAYRDWVIRSLNANKPFDEFTIEQLAGDLLSDPTNDQLIATAFHRNTLTNSEGGTNDEEFRNVAIVDRVNTTLAVWMGTTIACAQCHTHKYDPITQTDFFRVFAIFNNTQDADRRDESPLLEIWTDEQKAQKEAWLAEISDLEKTLATPTPELAATQQAWESRFRAEPEWQPQTPQTVGTKSGVKSTVTAEKAVLIEAAQPTDIYTVEMPLNLVSLDKPEAAITAVRLEALSHASLPGMGPGFSAGNFVITRLTGTLTPPPATRLAGRYVRIEIPGDNRILSLAEVQVFQGTDNIALKGQATQSSVASGGPPQFAIDGKTDGVFAAQSTTHTATESNPWWEVDLKSIQSVDRIVLWNRTDGNVGNRLKDFRVSLLDEERKPIWEQSVATPPNPSSEFSLAGARNITFVAAYADHSQPMFDAAFVLDEKNPNQKGWAVGGALGQAHAITLIPDAPITVPADSKLTLTIEQLSQFTNHTLGHFRVSVTTDAGVADYAQTPAAILTTLKIPPAKRSEADQAMLTKHYFSVAPMLEPQRKQLAAVRQQLAEQKPATSVPIMRAMAEGQQRKTFLQHRGNFLDLGPEVTAGVPEALHPLGSDQAPDRLALARWLMDSDNPLTARVIANRYWESIFGRGIVTTSEEFGSQGDLPSHPELLDWLATELVRLEWDTKAFLKLLVTSATYRQSSRVTPELLDQDPDNILLARGPRFRLSAEMIRDQALAVSGLLSPRLYGPPVKPPQPKIGLSAAFGSGIDWQTSSGEDRYRRGLYTTWRRSNPYPSMAAFDAPNREVCTIRRSRTNTPLQALVTLNDPVYIETAQALSRKVVAAGGSPEEMARLAFQICLTRPPQPQELKQLTVLFTQAKERLSKDPAQAMKLATVPLGPAPEGVDSVDLAAWTVVSNVLLNLDEMLMKR